MVLPQHGRVQTTTGSFGYGSACCSGSIAETVRYHQPLFGVCIYTYRFSGPAESSLAGTVAEKPLFAKVPPMESAISGRLRPTEPSASLVPPLVRSPLYTCTWSTPA